MTPIETAFSWHGGGGSPMYRYASNRRIDDEQHRKALLLEIQKCINWHTCYGHAEQEPGDIAALEALKTEAENFTI